MKLLRDAHAFLFGGVVTILLTQLLLPFGVFVEGFSTTRRLHSHDVLDSTSIRVHRTHTTTKAPFFLHNQDKYNDGFFSGNRHKFIVTNLLSRRAVVNSTTAASIVAVLFGGGGFHAAAAVADDDVVPTTISSSSSSVTVPLEFIPKLGAYVVHFYLFGERFGAVLDTGSPFLTVPFRCNKFAYKYRWGCYRPERTHDSGYSNTIEGFDNNQGTVVWRKAGFSFFDDDETMTPSTTTTQQSVVPPPTKDVVFGVLGEALMDGSGGVFFGLIKETDKWIRPSFMGQMGYTSFCVDLRSNANETRTPQLTLSKARLIGNLSNDGGDDGGTSSQDYIPLVRDLNRRYKAPVVHYSARPSNFVVNGLPLKLDNNNKRRPTYVIFDTGVTRMAVSQELFDGRYLQARKNREKSLWGQVNVEFKTQQGKTVALSVTKPVTTPLGKETPFRGFKGNLIVLGLAFLDGRAMTIDIEGGRLHFD